METQDEIDYNRIARAITYIRTHLRDQPGLEEAAGHVNMSPFHFQRMFKEWAGVTPKQFLQFITAERAREVLQKRATLAEAAFESGLSGTGRLHDLFLKLEAMTPGEFRNGGENLEIRYSFAGTPFGPVLLASTHAGLCYLAFADEGKEVAFIKLTLRFPKARITYGTDGIQESALRIFAPGLSDLTTIKLHLKASPFQIKVWEALLKVKPGSLTTYAELARRAGHPLACRAVGTAVGSNPVAFLIPCHRVIRSTGETGQYHWGVERKNMMIGWEAAREFKNSGIAEF